jgi:DNA transformation protein
MKGRVVTAMPEQTFKDQVLDRLASLGEVTSRAMFGGHGIYWRGVIFGIVFRDRPYLKVDDGSRGDILARGMGPFRPVRAAGHAHG